MGKLVMIIDDSLTVRKIMETSLKREGFESVSYSDGIEALKALTQPGGRIPDLVILDIGLPKMNGYEIARRLRTKQQYNNTVIIMLTGRDGVLDRLKGRLAGAKDYITKPFRTQEVMSVVHSHLGIQAKGMQQEPVAISPSFDYPPARHLAQLSDREFWQLACEQATRAGKSACHEEYIECTLDSNGHRCWLSLEALSQAVPPPHRFALLPAMPPWMVGLIAWRGETLAAIDLAA